MKAVIDQGEPPHFALIRGEDYQVLADAVPLVGDELGVEVVDAGGDLGDIVGGAVGGGTRRG